MGLIMIKPILSRKSIPKPKQRIICKSVRKEKSHEIISTSIKSKLSVADPLIQIRNPQRSHQAQNIKRKRINKFF